MPSSLSSIAALPLDQLAAPQRRWMERFGVRHSVDIHCHCLPSLDDGPATQLGALALCRALVEDGITTVIATPHQLGRYHDRNDGPSVRAAVAALNRALMFDEVPLRVLPGGDVRVDERIVRLLHERKICTLADGGTFLLLELPRETFIDPAPLLRQLVSLGVRPVISHPERNRFLTARPELVDPWLAGGAALQVTAGSVCGDFGATAERAAWYFLSTGRAELVASDAHDAVRRPPRMTEAARRIAARLGEAVAARVCAENPARVLDGAALPAAREASDARNSSDPLADLNL